MLTLIINFKMKDGQATKKVFDIEADPLCKF